MSRKDLTSETAQDTFDVAARADALGIEPYQVRAMNAVNTQLVRDLVNDFRPGATPPSSMAGRPSEPEPEKKGNGWYDAAPLSRPQGLWRESRDERILRQQEEERREIERRISGDSEPLIQSEFNPFDKENMSR